MYIFFGDGFAFSVQKYCELQRTNCSLLKLQGATRFAKEKKIAISRFLSGTTGSVGS